MLLWLSILWVFASAVVAVLPMRWQYVPGLILMIVAPILIFEIARTAGFLVAAAGLAAFVSMYRNPLKYVWTRLTGQQVELPK